MKQIATALVKAQKAFGPALKSSLNPHFKSKYAALDACIEAVIDGLNDNGIFLLQKNHNCDNGVMVETVFIHESGEQIECGIVHFPAVKQDPQGYASALTYARRYSLMAACGIAPEDDDGNKASEKKFYTHSNLEEIDKHIKQMYKSETEEALKASYKIAYQACFGDKTQQDKVIKAKDEIRTSLEQ